MSNRNIKYRRTQSRELPGLGPYLFIREKPPLLFCRFRFANSYMQWTHGARLQKHLRNRHGTMLHWTCNVFRAYGGNHGSKPQLWRVPFHKGNPTEAISQSDAQRLFAPTAFPTEANGKEFAFCSILEALWKQAKITIPPHAKNRRIKHRRTQS